MTDQQTCLLQAILLELKCMNEAMRSASEDVTQLRGDLLEVTGLLREARLDREFSVRNASALLGQPPQ